MKEELEEIIKESDMMYEAGLAMFMTGKYYAGQYMTEAITARYNYLAKQPFMTKNVLFHLSLNKNFLLAQKKIYELMEEYKK